MGATGEQLHLRPTAPAVGGLVVLVQPMIGVEGATSFVIGPLEVGGGRYSVMRSVEFADLSFVVASPHALYPDYRFKVPERLAERLGVGDEADAETWVLITRDGALGATANLLGPLVVNPLTRDAAQVVLCNSGYRAAVPLHSGTARPW